MANQYTIISVVSISCLLLWFPNLKLILDETKIWAYVYGDQSVSPKEILIGEDAEDGMKRIYVCPETAKSLPAYRIVTDE